MKRLVLISAIPLALVFNHPGAAENGRDSVPLLFDPVQPARDSMPEMFEPAEPARDSMPEISDPVELIFESNLDSLLNLWYVQNTPSHNRVSLPEDNAGSVIPEFTDSVYMERLSRIPSVIDLSFNRTVKNYIDLYTRQRREQMAMMLGLTDYYFPIFDQVLDYYDIPFDLRYLPVIESALNPRAVSRAGATGIWQFMFGTARMYNLTMNSLVDERRDPLASTHAAARYLKDLYSVYNDWTLVLAAYNCGPGTVNRAIQRAGGSRNYWDIYYLLPRETRGYVPAFIAATYAMNYHEDYGIVPADFEIPEFTDTIMINRELHLGQVAEVLDIPLRMLRDINPQYRRDIIPASDRSYSLRLPVTQGSQFLAYKDSIYAHRADHFLSRENLAVTPQRSTFTPSPPAGHAQVNYTVKQGDNLGYIAEWFNVRAQDLRNWNNIRGSLIRTGQRLVVYVSSDHTDYYREMNNMGFAEKQAMIGRSPATNQPGGSLEADSSGEYLYYTVRPGDTLWDIARQFPDISDSDILRINQLSNAHRIYPGQRLKIKPQV